MQIYATWPGIVMSFWLYRTWDVFKNLVQSKYQVGSGDVCINLKTYTIKANFFFRQYF